MFQNIAGKSRVTLLFLLPRRKRTQEVVYTPVSIKFFVVKDGRSYPACTHRTPILFFFRHEEGVAE